MAHDHSPTQIVDRVIGLRLQQLQRATGLPVVFGGSASTVGERRELTIGHLRGTFGESLRGLKVLDGRGLGGTALLTRSPCRVNDYANTRTITHDFDDRVVDQERISSVFALPLSVSGGVGGVVYGAVRGPQRIGDIVLDQASAFVRGIEREIATVLRPPGSVGSAARAAAATPPRSTSRGAVNELRRVAASVTDMSLASTLTRIVDELEAQLGYAASDAMNPAPLPDVVRHLAPREVEVLRLVAVGMTNRDIATTLTLSVETVRAYLQSAMRRLDVRTRTAAVHVARTHEIL